MVLSDFVAEQRVLVVCGPLKGRRAKVVRVYGTAVMCRFRGNPFGDDPGAPYSNAPMSPWELELVAEQEADVADDPGILTLEVMAEQLNTCVKTIKRWVAAGKLCPPTSRLGGRPYWAVVDVERWERGRGKQ